MFRVLTDEEVKEWYKALENILKDKKGKKKTIQQLIKEHKALFKKNNHEFDHKNYPKFPIYPASPYHYFWAKEILDLSGWINPAGPKMVINDSVENFLKGFNKQNV